MHRRSAKTFLVLLIAISPFIAQSQQEPDRPSFEAKNHAGEIELDGRLNEGDWLTAPVLSDFTMIEPTEGVQPSYPTDVRVLANARVIYFGIRCKDSHPGEIVRFTKLRDGDLSEEDHIRIVIDPFQDGQSGYVFAVNANGARYDALVVNRGEGENSQWDAVWEAAATIDSTGWSVEMKLPIQSINFKKDLSAWGFNVERRIQRNQETMRWANAQRDQWFIQTSRAGYLTNLPAFDYGLGLTLRPSLVVDYSRTGVDGSSNVSLEPSLDASQRISPNILGSVTINTDFAETEVDTRQTNLTRFPLFFPEKRSFFLEGSDIFEFGLGTGSTTVLPFFSRNIGLYRGQRVPVQAGAKLNGRAGKTAFGGLITRTGEFTSVNDTLSNATLGAVRVRQNVLRESSAGFIATFGDQLNRSDSWMSGADFTFQTTRFRKDKNFLVGGWGLLTNREGLSGDRSAVGVKIDYPNDLWDIVLSYARIGDGFDPSLGFVPRMGVHYFRTGFTYAPRPKSELFRQLFYELYFTYIAGLSGDWQSYTLFSSPVNWLFESGDQVSLSYNPQGEQLFEPFEIEEDILIQAGRYHFTRYGLEVETAAKRRLSGEAIWLFGSFYDGNLHEVEATLTWRPSAFIHFELSGERNFGQLEAGDFDQTLLGFLLRINITPDLQLNSFAQYDTDSHEVGLNARIHWIFSSLGEAFLVFNHNVLDKAGEPRELLSQQILAKVRYSFRL